MNKQERALYRIKEAVDRANHKRKLEEEHGLANHPKADRLYSLAWEHGHAYGFDEVGFWYAELVDLLK